MPTQNDSSCKRLADTAAGGLIMACVLGSSTGWLVASASLCVFSCCRVCGGDGDGDAVDTSRARAPQFMTMHRSRDVPLVATVVQQVTAEAIPISASIATTGDAGGGYSTFPKSV